MEEQQPSQKKRVRDGSPESESDSPEVKRMRDDLLGILDNLDDRDTSSQDLDSVMKSFEEELSGSGYNLPLSTSHVVTEDIPDVDFTPSLSGEARPPELGFLFQAFDEELGIPTTTTDTTEKEQKKDDELKKDDNFVGELVSSDSSTITEFFWPFDDADVPSYDSFGFVSDGRGNNEDRKKDGDVVDGNGGEYVSLDGTFDYSDVNFGSSDYSDGSWNRESLPAL